MVKFIKLLLFLFVFLRAEEDSVLITIAYSGTKEVGDISIEDKILAPTGDENDLKWQAVPPDQLSLPEVPNLVNNKTPYTFENGKTVLFLGTRGRVIFSASRKTLDTLKWDDVRVDVLPLLKSWQDYLTFYIRNNRLYYLPGVMYDQKEHYNFHGVLMEKKDDIYQVTGKPVLFAEASLQS